MGLFNAAGYAEKYSRWCSTLAMALYHRTYRNVVLLVGIPAAWKSWGIRSIRRPE
jgi:hypothetical protein